MQRIVTILLVLVALGGVGMAFYRNSGGQASGEPAVALAPVPEAMAQSAGANGAAAPAPVAGPTIIVTYYTNKVRCASCLKIEELTRRAVETRFAEHLAAGRVAYRMVDVDVPQNRHFVTDYQLVSKSVVVAEVAEGKDLRWVNLPEVWVLLRNEQAFLDYVAAAVDAWL